ncbi:hypothetical protein [Chroococcidiopsis cubana]|uniref:hypothetical protein n=1 Tax=Chroococcidiopsis cubana TaxID=171392 RepID=UPI002ACD7461|nr:hypothetical protein [Chroococcidiopsis cubana]
MAAIFSRIWAGELIQPQDIQPRRNPSMLKVIESTYPRSSRRSGTKSAVEP